jgi:signal transduction histidine kinase
VTAARRTGAAAPRPGGALAFLAGGGRLGELIAAHDWSRTALGPIQGWPAHVRAATSLMLRSRVPIVMLWGEPGVMVYNDAYSVFAGRRHPALLGSDVREGWPEVAEFNDHVMKVGLAGGNLSYRDQELTLHRHGRAEPVWMNLDYSPLLDERGVPAGVMAVVVETTEKVLAERAVGGERARLAQLFAQAPSFMAVVEGPEHRFALANASYLRLVGRADLVGRTVAEALPDAAEQGWVALLDQVYRSGEAFSGYGARYDRRDAPAEPTQPRYVDFILQPIRGQAGEVTGIFMEGVDATGRVAAEQRRDALVRLSERLRDLEDPAAIGRAAAELIGATLHVARAGYAVVEPDGESLRVERDWTAPGVASGAGVHPLHAAGVFVDVLRRGEFVAVADVQAEPRTAAVAAQLQARHARAYVHVPVLEQGRLVALLYVDHPAPRAWTADDVDFAREVTQRTRMAFERARDERARRAAARAREDALAEVAAIDRKFRALVTASSDVVYRMSADWSQMRELDGRDFLRGTGADAPMTDWMETYIPADERPRVRSAIARAIAARAPFELEHQVVQADGTVGWTFSRAIPVFDERGEVTEWFGAASDVTRRKRAERELHESEERLRETDRRKDEFLATLAHELRNPLAPIRNAVHLLAMPGGVAQLPRLRGMLERQVGHMVRLVDDLLEISRVSRGQITLRWEEVDAGAVIEAAVEASRPLVDQARHHLVVEPPPQPLWVRGDAMRLSQVFVNLLNNAARYTEPGGVIELACAQQAGWLVVTVTDNGVGIAADQLPRLFEMFTQIDRAHSRAQGGLGIGLALSRRLLEMHGGTLEAASAGLGQGSRFTVRLPLAAGPAAPAAAPEVAAPEAAAPEATAAEAAASAAAASAPADPDTAAPATAVPESASPEAAATPAAAPAAVPEAAPAAPRRVLIVDDNHDAADTTGLLLRSLGAQVRIAYDGAQALAAIAEWSPGLVLLDLGMPGMDGHEVARRIRAAHGRRAPVLAALTGWGQDGDRARTRAAGFDHHLVKPVGLAELRGLLERA